MTLLKLIEKIKDKDIKNEVYDDEPPDHDDMSGDEIEENEGPAGSVGFTKEDKEMFAIADTIESIEDGEE